MAYMNVEMKKNRTPAVQAVLKKYGMKGTLSIRNNSTLVLTLSTGKIAFDLGEDTYRDVNVYQISRHYDGIARDFLLEVKGAMNVGNHDNSDIQTDYFDVGFYVDIKIGKWNKPYVCEE